LKKRKRGWSKEKKSHGPGRLKTEGEAGTQRWESV